MKNQISSKSSNDYFSFINLWCTKNLVDTQHILGRMFVLAQEDPSLKLEYHVDPRAPEVSRVFLNTCGFISAGRDEMMHTIEKLQKAGKQVTVMGCGLRYFQLTNQEIKGVDTIERQDLDRFTLQSPRAYTNAHLGFEYIKIAEGCDNHCSFCIIPKLRGKQRSKTIATVLEEAKSLIEQGVQELILIAQDSTRYGRDLEDQPDLLDLLEALDALEGDFSYRVLYMYPDSLTMTHLDRLAELEKFIPYFDFPFQHSHPDVLKRMGRFSNDQQITALLAKIAELFPLRFVRTNIIIGFPGETDEEFAHVKHFLEVQNFDNVALFEYHDEPLAASSKLPNKIDSAIIRDRFLLLDEIVNKQLDSKQEERKSESQHGRIQDFGKNTIIIRPRLHAPDIDETDRVALKNIISDTKEIHIWDLVEYKL